MTGGGNEGVDKRATTLGTACNLK
jgi:hypothetical protein